MTVDERMSGEKVLRLFGRFEPLHLPLSSSRWSMRVLGPIVQVSALLVLDAGKQLTPSDTITPQLVGHDQPRDVLQTLQKPPEEALRGVAIAPGLNEDVEHNTILMARQRYCCTPWIRMKTSSRCHLSLAAAGGGAGGRRNSHRISCTTVAPSRRRPRRHAQPGAAQHPAG